MDNGRIQNKSERTGTIIFPVSSWLLLSREAYGGVKRRNGFYAISPPVPGTVGSRHVVVTGDGSKSSPDRVLKLAVSCSLLGSLVRFNNLSKCSAFSSLDLLQLSVKGKLNDNHNNP